MMTTAEHIAQSTRRIREAEERIVRREVRITVLLQSGRDTTDAEALLRRFNEDLRLLHYRADELRQKLANELREPAS